MKVFISWSGELSHKVAELLGSWIPDVLSGVSIWLSSEDLEKGSIWFGDLSQKLEENSFGILCLTRENQSAPWVLFEAGALSKGLSSSRVCPILVDIDTTDLMRGPLTHFNATKPTKDDMLKLVKTINSHTTEMAGKPPADDKVRKHFDKWWGDFEKPFRAIVTGYKPATRQKPRPDREILDEILEIVRRLQSTRLDKYLVLRPDESRLRELLLSARSPQEIARAHTVLDALINGRMAEEAAITADSLADLEKHVQPPRIRLVSNPFPDDTTLGQKRKKESRKS
jgi:hypothetical protein